MHALPSAGSRMILAGLQGWRKENVSSGTGEGGDWGCLASSSSTCKCLLIAGQARLELFSFYVESCRKGTPRKVRSSFVCLFWGQTSHVKPVRDAFTPPSPVAISTLPLQWYSFVKSSNEASLASAQWTQTEFMICSECRYARYVTSRPELPCVWPTWKGARGSRFTSIYSNLAMAHHSLTCLRWN